MKTEHFNKLTEAEAELLAILAEECGEVVQAVCKILRHGIESHDPTDLSKGTNRDMLAKECGQLRAAIRMLEEKMIVSPRVVEAHDAARFRSKPYTHHQE